MGERPRNIHESSTGLDAIRIADDLPFIMRQLITYLSRFAVLRRTIQVLRVHRFANLLLRIRPLVKKVPGSTVTYRAASLESIPLAVEMFEKGTVYDRAFLRKIGPIETFADLGCNVGYFTCLLASLNAKAIKGLMIDANGDVVKEAAWNAGANQLNQVYALHGIVGEPSPTGEAQFYVYESSICSSSERGTEAQAGLKGEWKETKVPCLNIEKIWTEKFGSARCHLLKVDIEGSEMKFLETENSFLTKVDSILLEWHKWRVQLPEIQTYLEKQGFALSRIFEEDSTMGTCFFHRPSQRVAT